MSAANKHDLSPPTATRSLSPMGRLVRIGLLAGMALAVLQYVRSPEARSPFDPRWESFDPAPLVMEGGDPYIRALMRTISYSESNDPQPYSLIYGGDRITDLSRHPDRCVPILTGPNLGDCTTAAGRYQFITTTWEEQAAFYHPDPDGWWLWRAYSFAPEHQDQVVHDWLMDPVAWGIDLSTLLRNGQVTDVLYILSPTWTSLGYGIETNDLSASLPYVYEQVLQEELAQVEASAF
ncbi:MAG: glycoside hydrolase family protein [Cyanobacteria bacterium J06638_22]